MRRTVCLLAALLILPSLGSDSPKEYGDATEIDEIQGTWKQVEFEAGGTKIEKGVDDLINLRDGVYSINYRKRGEFRCTYRIDPTRKPAHLDIIVSNGPNPGETLLCIYQVNGDTLRMARSSINPRPKDFNEEGIAIYTYKRVK